MFGNIGSSELTVLIIIGVLLFGGKRVTEIAKNLGQAKKELENAKREYEKALSDKPDKSE